MTKITFTAYAVTGHTSDMTPGMLVEKITLDKDNVEEHEAVSDTGDLADDWGISPDDEDRLDTDAADAELAKLGWQRITDWVTSDGQWIADVEPAPGTTMPAEVDVIDGAVRVLADSEDIDISQGPNGKLLFLLGDLEPWGEDEYGMERADAKLANMGWQRVSDWEGEEIVTCQVRPA